jgi:gliding motility-associated lipoprotein GldD
LKRIKKKHNPLKLKLTLLFSALALVFTGCDEDFSPKPRAYYRIDLPEKEYQLLETACPYTFEYPVYAEAIPDKRPASEPCWMNVEFPGFHATLHLSYKKINGNLDQYIEEARSLTYKHISKATDIRENLIVNDSAKVYGILYDVKGDAASHIQFYVTDSLKHSMRGSLYFNAPPNQDSIAPVLNFIKKDIYRMIDSFRWND